MSSKIMSKNKKRIIYGILFSLLFIVEVLIALFIDDSFVRPYVGDMLVVIVVYMFLRMLIPEGVKHMIFYIFIFAVFVELLQYFKIIKILGLSNNTFARIILGSTFDLKDILCYAAGCIILFFITRFMNSRKVL